MQEKRSDHVERYSTWRKMCYMAKENHSKVRRKHNPADAVEGYWRHIFIKKHLVQTEAMEFERHGHLQGREGAVKDTDGLDTVSGGPYLTLSVRIRLFKTL